MQNLLKSRKFWAISGVSLVTLLILVWIGVSLTVLYLAPSLTFQTDPSKDLEYDVQYTTVFRDNSDGEKIEIIITNVDSVDQLNTSEPAILYLHGNVGRLPYIVEDASEFGVVISPAYPGYSESDGEASADKIYETVDVTMNYLKDLGYTEDNIIILGHSMGGSPAMYAARDYPDLKEVNIVNTFYSLQKMCEIQYSIFCIFGGGFMNTSNIAVDARAKVNMYCNPDDDYIPTEQCRDLYEKVASEDKTLFDTTGDHSTFPVETVLGEK